MPQGQHALRCARGQHGRHVTRERGGHVERQVLAPTVRAQAQPGPADHGAQPARQLRGGAAAQQQRPLCRASGRCDQLRILVVRHQLLPGGATMTPATAGVLLPCQVGLVTRRYTK